MVVGIGIVILVVTLVLDVPLFTDQITVSPEQVLGEKVHSIVHLLCFKLPLTLEDQFHKVELHFPQMLVLTVITLVEDPLVQVLVHLEPQ